MLSCFTPLFVGRGDMFVVFSSKCFSPLFGGRGDMVVVFVKVVNTVPVYHFSP